MKLRFTRQALADLDQARTYIAERNPRAAVAMAVRIREAIDGLSLFPDRRRPGRISGTRERVIPATPFIVAYRVGNGHIDACLPLLRQCLSTIDSHCLSEVVHLLSVAGASNRGSRSSALVQRAESDVAVAA